MFIKAANELFSEKAEIIENTKTMMDMVCNTDELDKELGDKVAELNIIAEQMQTAIAENSRTALDCQTAHCGRGKSHFIFGGLASPIVPYRNLTQTTDGITADCRSLV